MRMSRIGLMASFMVLFMLHLSGSPARSWRPVAESAAGDLLQRTSGGHVFGFERGGMYVVGRDHAANIRFVGARPVAPLTEQGTETQHLEAGTQSSLVGVTYQDLWEGITLKYEQHDRGLGKSTYYVAPGAAVEQIRLRYNVPLSLDAQGNLMMAFPTGILRESAPVSWQEVNGRRSPVDVRFRLLGDHEVGLTISNRKPSAGIVIDPTLSWGIQTPDGRHYGHRYTPCRRFKIGDARNFLPHSGNLPRYLRPKSSERPRFSL